jgi:hypothetical protein
MSSGYDQPVLTLHGKFLRMEFLVVAATIAWTFYDFIVVLWANIMAWVREFELDLERRQRNIVRTNIEAETRTEPPVDTQTKTPKEPPPLDDKKQARIGKFRDLKGFVKPMEPDYDNYDNADPAELQPGDIIHILSSAAKSYPEHLCPLHQRVMLVLRSKSNPLICVPFCRRDGQRSKIKEGCWPIQQDPVDFAREGEQSGSATRGLDQAEQNVRHVHPFHGHPSPGFWGGVDPRPKVRCEAPCRSLVANLTEGLVLETGITMNLADLWRVDCGGIFIKEVGWINNDRLKAVVHGVKALECSWLDGLSLDDEKPGASSDEEHIPPPPPPPPPPAPAAVPVRHKIRGKDLRSGKSGIRRSVL